MAEGICAAAPNRLIAGLPERERQRLLSGGEPVELICGDVLCVADTPLRYVYFPHSGFVSLVASVSGHQPLDLGIIGSEGMLGATIVLGVNAVPLRGIVYGSGLALRVSASRFKHELVRSPALLRTMHRYLYVMMAQLAQAFTCIHFHEVNARLARCLLMTHDCAHASHFHLTHQFLANMLGVRRSGISTAASALQARGLIDYTRGEIQILNRNGLEAASCECYAASINDYAQRLN